MTGTTQAASLRAGRWQLRSTLSCARFAVRNLGVWTVHGQVPIRVASVEVNRTGRPVAVHAALDLAGIDTGNARRDADLRKPGLLGTAKFPLLTFTGGPAERAEAGWSLPGRIEAHGAEVSVLLAATVLERGDFGDVAVSVTTELDRRTLGIRAPRLLIGPRIRVTIDAVFAAPN